MSLARRVVPLLLIVPLLGGLTSAAGSAPIAVEGQPLAANVERVLEALDTLGAPLPTAAAVRKAARERNSQRLQELLDPQVLTVVTLNPETRVKVERGPGRAALQQAAYTPVLVKLVNQSTATGTLRISSPQAGPPYGGVADLSMQRQRQQHLKSDNPTPGRFLQVEMLTAPPLTSNLSGLETEYAVALIYSSESGKREATLAFDLGAGTKDLGSRATVPILFDVRPVVPVKLEIRDFDGKPTAARLIFRDSSGRVYPPQARRLAPDFFFQKQVYRADGGKVLLPPGELTVTYCRGPEYRQLTRKFTVPAKGPASLKLRLERWVNPQAYGFYSGDHHIHGAGCAHYTSPTEGVSPADMFLNVKGEGLNVGCVLTWGPCFEFQRQFFSPGTDKQSEPLTLLKYDLEISGFGSQALGHVCLLNLKDQNYPGSDGTKTKGWPLWTTPVLRWAKAQGAVTGYAHAASGLQIDPAAQAKRLLAALDGNADGRLDRAEAGRGLLPEPFETADANRDGLLTELEFTASHDRAAEQLPNLAIPEMNGVGAMEACVTVANGLCDFISSMDTARIQEWNTWYHLLNCGFPVKTSGETDFPCMSGTRVGQGRVYVQLGKTDRVDFPSWCEGIKAGRSYVSDGFAHALEFTVGGKSAGSTVALDAPGELEVRTKVAFSAQTPLDVAQGTVALSNARRLSGDTVNKHDPVYEERFASTEEKRRVELIVNGRVVETQEVPADDRPHDLRFRLKLDRSSWVAVRQFPQLHTNPVTVLVGGKPIRASRNSARWCIGVIEQLWRNRERNIPPAERDEARKTFFDTIERYRKIAAECPEGS